MSNRKVRFFYAGGWTRWFDSDEDLAMLYGIPVDMMETQELMTKQEAEEYLKKFNNAD